MTRALQRARARRTPGAPSILRMRTASSSSAFVPRCRYRPGPTGPVGVVDSERSSLAAEKLVDESLVTRVRKRDRHPDEELAHNSPRSSDISEPCRARRAHARFRHRSSSPPPPPPPHPPPPPTPHRIEKKPSRTRLASITLRYDLLNNLSRMSSREALVDAGAVADTRSFFALSRSITASAPGSCLIEAARARSVRAGARLPRLRRARSHRNSVDVSDNVVVARIVDRDARTDPDVVRDDVASCFAAIRRCSGSPEPAISLPTTAPHPRTASITDALHVR